ncbi:MAG TPA: alpha/beta fold hydrolase [Methylomirabilota bacterium]|nr:alpha/beta fold hydrolase [Methylomirabilota bacterium]
MPHATLNGIRIHYEVYGQGDPVLLVSGLGGAAVGWLLQVKDLSARYQVITFDNRGVGESDVPDLPAYPTALLADDAAAVLDHLGVARAHVVGASMGGTIAMELAIRHPRKVRSLSICCSWARGDGRFIQTIRSWMALAPRLSVEDRFRHVLFPWIYSPAFLADEAAVAEALKRALAYPHPTRPEGLVRQGEGLIAWNGTRIKEIKRIKAPTQVLVGKADILTPPAFSRELAGLIPNARLRILPGGHGVFLEEAPRLNGALLDFLGAITR